MSDLERIVVLAGGLSPEREVSLRSGDRVRDALAEAGIHAVVADADAALLSMLRADPPSAVFPAIHGVCGEVGAIAVIDLIVARLGLPLYVKPSRGGSALGAGAVRTAADLPAAVLSCFAYGDTALIERFISGTEVAVGVVDLGQGPQALPAVEIVPGEGEYDYAARYTAGKTEIYVPARLPAAVADEVARIAIAAHTVLGLRDLSRTDLIVDADGTAWFLEVNV